MPGGNGTGPMGMGPMTGRGAGFCVGYGVPGYVNSNPWCGMGMGFRGGQVGRGRGYGRGMGGGFRNRFYAAGMAGWQGVAGAEPYAEPTREQELEMAKSQLEYFENALDGIRKRIAELDAKETK
jgi:hypothetical protein